MLDRNSEFLIEDTLTVRWQLPNIKRAAVFSITSNALIRVFLPEPQTYSAYINLERSSIRHKKATKKEPL